ncbi:ABC transporter ATP-binding protein [Arenimonas aestuarii]
MSARIIANNVSLDVPNFVQAERSAKTFLSTLFAAATSRPKREYRTILEDVSLEAREGDRIALLGRNGAGKTTLLRVLSGAFQPTRGEVEVHGSRQALLNLGLGFHVEATVRENIFLRAAAMSLPAREVSALLPSILEFSGLEECANHRLATLSSGQRMRLGFAISTSVQHDIMLMDEWFGAGDAEFVDKARMRMTDRVQGSKIVVLASHNFQMLREICNVGLVLDYGKVVHAGPIREAIDAYKAIYQSTPEYLARRAQIEAKETPEAKARRERAERRERQEREERRLARERRLAAEGKQAGAEEGTEPRAGQEDTDAR